MNKNTMQTTTIKVHDKVTRRIAADTTKVWIVTEIRDDGLVYLLSLSQEHTASWIEEVVLVK